MSNKPAILAVQFKFSERTGASLIPDWVKTINIGLKKENGGLPSGELVLPYQAQRVSLAKFLPSLDSFGLFLTRAQHVCYQVKVQGRGIAQKHRLEFEWELEYVPAENLEQVRDLFSWFASGAVYGVRGYNNPGNIWRFIADNRRTPKDDGFKPLGAYALELTGDRFVMSEPQ